MGKSSQELVNRSGQLSRLSDYQRNKRNSRQDSRPSNSQPKNNSRHDTSNKQDKPDKNDKPDKSCGNCGKKDHTSRLNDRRENCPAFDKMCPKCDINGHFGHMCRGGTKPKNDRSKSGQRNNLNKVKADEKSNDERADLGTLTGGWMLLNGIHNNNNSPTTRSLKESLLSSSSVSSTPGIWSTKEDIEADLFGIQQMSTKKLRHHIMDEFGKWKVSHVEPHGRVQVQVKICNSAARQLGISKLPQKKTISVSALCDTGAQMCVSDWNLAKEMGLKKSDILTPALTISTADNAKLELIGATFLTLFTNTGEYSQQLVYFAIGVGQFYLSKSAMKDLGIISRDFPKIGSCATIKQS